MATEPTIHIVDDDEPVRDSLQVLLESYGLSCRAYRCCEDFIASFIAGRPGCLLLDLHLPDMSGLDLLRAHGERLKSMTVILMSGQWDERAHALAAEVGAAATIEKPIDDELLIATVRNAFRREEKPVLSAAMLATS